MVYPGGKARCIFSDSPDYGFQVVPRDRDKVLLFFEGGGACWNALTTTIGACHIQKSQARPLVGVMNHSVAANPFRNYTLVYLSGCSGDLHTGNVVRGYVDRRGELVQQRGYYNTRSTIDWVKANLGVQRLSSLFVSGESAGSIAVQVWSATLLRELPSEHASVIADSYVGVFPRDFQGPLFQQFGVCDTELLSFDTDLLAKCHSGRVTFQDAYEATIRAFPQVRFGSINSKFDSTQMLYYALASASMGRPQSLDRLDFHQRMTAILRRYVKYPNHASFLLTSDWHVYTFITYNDYGELTDKVFTGGFNGTQRELGTWLASFHEQGASPMESHCELLDRAATASKLGVALADVCDRALGSRMVQL